MKVKTSITLEPATLASIDELASEPRQRSQIIERAILDYIAREGRRRRDLADLAILDGMADSLNEELADALSDQADV